MAQPSPREVFYPDTDNMGEHELQRLIMELLRPLLARYFTEKGVEAHVGADTFLYFVEGDPTRRVAPDVYVFPGMPQDVIRPSYKLWEVGRAPSFVFEVVTSDWTKDYDDIPASYGSIGVEELVVYDPEAPPRHPRRARWQVFRRAGPQSFPLAESSSASRVYSRSLGLYLCVAQRGAAPLVRIAESEAGPLYPTAEEAERTRAEAERTRAEAERQRAQEALAEVERLRAELERLKKV